MGSYLSAVQMGTRLSDKGSAGSEGPVADPGMGSGGAKNQGLQRTTVMSLTTIFERVADASGGIFLLAIGILTGGALALVGS